MPITPDPSRSHAKQYYTGHFNAQMAAYAVPEGRDQLQGRESAQVLTHGIGKGTAALRKQWALDTTQNIQNPPFSRRKNLNAGGVPLIVWVDPGKGPDPQQARTFKTGPAYYLSKAISGFTRDETGAIRPFAKVVIFRTSDNVKIAETVSDALGYYSVTVPS
jgi:hypothetical protein